jgi:electron-transferring-flavoprotein dehydrogenase
VRDEIPYDFCVVGAGVAGLACALRLKQLQPDSSICLLEKGSALGVHSVSGAVLEPGPLEALLPNWLSTYPDMKIPVTADHVSLMTRSGSWRMPDWMVRMSPLYNRGNFIISLGQLVRWLGAQAEAVGVDIFTGAAAVSALFDDQGAVKGVRLGDMGLDRHGNRRPNFVPGADIVASATILAEGARGSISKQLIRHYRLDQGKNPPAFGLGLKELWQLPAGRVTPGRVEHTFGWPLDSRTYGGSFLYHLDGDRVYVGYVIGLNYSDPGLSPFEVLQQFKHHPQVKPLLEGGEVIEAGARVVAAGGYQSLPKLEMPGAILVGDAGGTLNALKIKGIHQAVRSGVLAAEHLHATHHSAGFDARWRASEGHRELRAVRNFKPGFKHGLYMGMANAGLEIITRGRTPWTLAHAPDAHTLDKITGYISPDRHWTRRTIPPRDRASSVFLAGNAHQEDQPGHLKIADVSICVDRCTREFGNPCQYFCPAGVYEMVNDGAAGMRLQINASNCIHCKACDVKDPYGIINWTPPEGGSGPNYQNL